MVAQKYPSLELIQIASPCAANWEDMVGDERSRHCSACNLKVYNLSDMSRDEATAFMAQREGRTCVRMFKRADGTVMTRDCPVGLAAVRAKFVRLTLATVGLFLALAATALAALGKLPGVGPYLSQGKLDHLQSIYSPALLPASSAMMGDVCVPPMRPGPMTPMLGKVSSPGSQLPDAP